MEKDNALCEHKIAWDKPCKKCPRGSFVTSIDDFKKRLKKQQGQIISKLLLDHAKSLE